MSFPRPQRRSPQLQLTSLAVLGACAALSLTTACGSSEKSADAVTPATPDTSSAAPDVLTVSASEWSYDISGSPHAGLVEIDFTNTGKAAHELGLVRLKDGVTLQQVKAALGKSEAAARALQADPDTEVTSAAILGPGTAEKAYVPLEAGHYAVTSFLPGPNGPQVQSGMIDEFTVLDAAGQTPPPSTDGTVTLDDQGITVPDGFAAGGTFEVTNAGTRVHDFSVAALKAPLPQYFMCVAQSFGKGSPVDDCPGTLHGGLTALRPGETGYVTLSFDAGRYGYVSTQGNGKDFQAGLNGTFTAP